MPRPPQPAPMVLDELHDTDPLALHPAEAAAMDDGAAMDAAEADGEDPGGS